MPLHDEPVASGLPQKTFAKYVLHLASARVILSLHSDSSNMDRYAKPLVYMLLLSGLCFATGSFFRKNAPPSPPTPGAIRVNIDAEDIEDQNNLIFGKAGGGPSLVFFGDYECPPCRREWKSVEQRLASHPERAIYFYHFPLVAIHPHAFSAAVASEEAKRYGCGVDVHQSLFKVILSPTSISNCLRKFNVSKSQCDAVELDCKKRITRDITLGMKLGIQGTPALFYVDSEKRVWQVPSSAALISN